MEFTPKYYWAVIQGDHVVGMFQDEMEAWAWVRDNTYSYSPELVVKRVQA